MVQRVLTASERRWWAGTVQRSRCSASCPAQGVAALLRGGRVVFLDHGGRPCRVALAAGVIKQLQCAQCAQATHGRGIRLWQDGPCSPGLRGRLLASGGEALLRVALAGGGVEEDNDDGQTDVANEGEDVPEVQVGEVTCFNNTDSIIKWSAQVN